MKFTFKTHDPNKSAPQDAENPKQKRREQIRRAQKTHRERKEAYTKSLEDEVTQLRTAETKALHQVNILQSRVTLLERLLLENGIAVPINTTPFEPEKELELPPTTFDLSIQKAKAKHRQKRIYIQRETSPYSLALSDSDPASTSPDSSQQHPTPRSLFSRWARDDQHSSPIDNLSSSLHTIALLPTSNDPFVSPVLPNLLHSLDPSIIGMDFVLALEGPCLAHTQTNHGHHGLMISATLLAQQPPPHSSPPAMNTNHHFTNTPPSSPSWQLTHAAIERLLEIARGIPLEGEITPVQAWDYVRKMDGYGTLEIERFEALKEKLVGRVRCYGFGAVIDQVDFENIVWEAFGVGGGY